MSKDDDFEEKKEDFEQGVEDFPEDAARWTGEAVCILTLRLFMRLLSWRLLGLICVIGRH
jgi:hypothetical protein